MGNTVSKQDARANVNGSKSLQRPTHAKLCSASPSIVNRGDTDIGAQDCPEASQLRHGIGFAGLHHPERQHGIGDLFEAGDVRSLDVIDIAILAATAFDTPLVDSFHDVE